MAGRRWYLCLRRYLALYVPVRFVGSAWLGGTGTGTGTDTTGLCCAVTNCYRYSNASLRCCRATVGKPHQPIPLPRPTSSRDTTKRNPSPIPLNISRCSKSSGLTFSIALPASSQKAKPKTNLELHSKSTRYVSLRKWRPLASLRVERHAAPQPITRLRNGRSTFFFFLSPTTFVFFPAFLLLARTGLPPC